jgi:hypothetical protein
MYSQHLCLHILLVLQLRLLIIWKQIHLFFPIWGLILLHFWVVLFILFVLHSSFALLIYYIQGSDMILNSCILDLTSRNFNILCIIISWLIWQCRVGRCTRAGRYKPYIISHYFSQTEEINRLWQDRYASPWYHCQSGTHSLNNLIIFHLFCAS